MIGVDHLTWLTRRQRPDCLITYFSETALPFILDNIESLLTAKFGSHWGYNYRHHHTMKVIQILP